MELSFILEDYNFIYTYIVYTYNIDVQVHVHVTAMLKYLQKLILKIRYNPTCTLILKNGIKKTNCTDYLIFTYLFRDSHPLMSERTDVAI